MGAAFQRPALVAHVHAAHAGCDFGVCVGIEPAQLARDLQRKLTRGRDDQAKGRSGADKEGFFACEEFIRNGETESNRFARTCARGDQEVAPFKFWRRGGGLDFGEVFITTFKDCRAQRSRQGFRQIHGGDKTFRRHNRCPMTQNGGGRYGRTPHTGEYLQ